MKFFNKYLVIPGMIYLLINGSFAQTNEKLRIALLDFSTTGGLSIQETITLANRLRSMLVKTNAFIVLERGKMEEILGEQGFQQSGCTTTECAVEVGKMLNVQKMVSGSIGKVGQTYTIDLALIDIKTAQIERSFFQDYKGEIDGLLSIMEEIAQNIASTAGQKPEPLKPPEETKKIFEISINSDPPGASILINNRRAGDTPFKSRVREGLTLEIKLQKTNYKEWSQRVTVSGDIEIDEKLELSDQFKQDLARRSRDQQPVSSPLDGGSNTWWYIGGGVVLVGAAAVLLMSGGGDGTDGNDEGDQGFPLPPGRP